MVIYGKKQRHLVENVSWQIVKSNDKLLDIIGKNIVPSIMCEI